MKSKLLSLLLVITLIAITVSVGFPATLAEETDNLFVNGDFADYSGNVPTNWRLDLKGTTTAEIVEDVEVADGLKVNAIKFTTPDTAVSNSSRSHFTYAGTIKIEKNAKYTMTYWVKASKIHGLRTYMFEPTYTALDGTVKTATQASDGTNIYSYTYDTDTTRVCRGDVKHSWTIAETGTSIDNSTVSMFVSRRNNVEQVLTPDYPSAERQNEWFQVIHTFETGDDSAHEANVAYDLVFPQVEGGEMWFADFRMSVEKEEVDAYYAPSVNDDTLGNVTPYGEAPLHIGKEATFTADPYGENKFDGWFVGDELVSTEKALTFVYDPENPPAYEARFTKAAFGIDGSFETGYTNGKVLAQSPDVAYNGKNDAEGLWTEDLFKQSSKDGNNMFFIDSEWAKHGNAVITNKYAHSGNFSVQFSPNSRAIGYKISGLNKNTEYTVSFYALTMGTTEAGKTIGSVTVTDANMSCVVKNSSNVIAPRTVEAGSLAKIDAPNVDYSSNWQKITVDFNTKNSTDIIVWARPEKAGTVTYLDDYAIARAPYKFKPAVNDFNLGFVTPFEGAVAVEGEEVTVAATPLDGNGFDGWYVDDTRVSTDLEYTHVFDSDTSMKLTAKFTPGKYAIQYAGFENAGYTPNQVIATNGSPTVDPWDIDSKFSGTWQKIMVSNSKAHTGTTSMHLSCQYSLAGFKVTGLEPETNYAFSFYAYANVSDKYNQGISEAFVLPSNIRPVVGSNHIAKADTLGYLKAFVNAEGEWTKVAVNFTTGSETDVTLWIVPSGDENPALHIDNLAVYEPIDASIASTLGGSVSSNVNSNAIAAGTKVQLTATPLEGNTFKGWMNLSGEIVSTDPFYEFIANESFNLTAVFEGYNMPALDVFASKGMDGTFENGTISGWFADDPTYSDSVSWCSWVRSAYDNAYEGSYALKVGARYRNTVLPITGLNTNTNYRFTFYVNQPDADMKAEIANFGIVGGTSDTHFASATEKLTAAQPGVIDANSGWHRIDLYFNTGENTAVNFIMRYNTDATNTYLWMDNISLYQYSGNETLKNGDFANGKDSWVGEATVANNTATFTEGDILYQTLTVEPYQAYTVSFKAKGDITAAVQEFNAYNLSAKKYITSKAYATATGSEEKAYTFSFYTGVHEAINLLFKAAGNATISDVKVVKSDSTGAYLEYIDFETDRFDLHNSNDAFSIYFANGADDKNVHSGTRSLKFTYNSALANTDVFFDEAFASYMGKNRSWKVTMHYKIAGATDGGAIRLAPEYTGQYGNDTGFEHTASDDGWHSISFFFNNSTEASMKLMIGSIAGSTTSDFYVDDISISVAPPLVSETATKLSYCESLYNVVDNESFEKPLSDKDWKGATANMKVISGEAQKGSNFLRVTANTHYVLELDVKPRTEYYFGASVRGTAATKGYIGIATDEFANSFYCDADENPASIIQPKADSTKWERTAFRFTTDGSGKAYLVIDVTSGALDIDSVMFFSSEYGYRYDPNDYTVYVPYDYDNLKSSSTVINGGLGSQPYYEDEDNGAKPETPATGDTRSITLPAVIIVLATVLAAALMFIRKRKDGVENA